MFKKLSSAYIVSIAKPIVEDWVLIAYERFDGVISDVTPDKIIIYINPRYRHRSCIIFGQA